MNGNNESTSFDPRMVTTSISLDGFMVTQNLGIVKGIIVRSRSIVGNIGASIQSIFGGNISIYTAMCEKARDDTYNLMCNHAQSLGANAIISVRYDTNEIAPGLSEVLCYGTAVIVQKTA
jgi:uncharacterized protein YbjQ (UPF0145 family)